jgi:hypothetical protein
LDDTRLKKSGKKVPPAFWSRDPLSPRFRANLLWGQRFLQASLLVALYQQDGQSGPRGLPGRFEEVPAVRKPGKKASPQAQAAYRRAQKAPNLSTAFVAMVQELRRCLDALGFGQKVVLAVGDGSFCNQTTFRRPFERTVLLTRARKNLRLCFPYQGPGRRVYTTAKTALPPRRFIKLRAAPGRKGACSMAGSPAGCATKEVNEVLWGGAACGSWCWRPRPTAKPKPAGLTTAKKPSCGAMIRRYAVTGQSAVASLLRSLGN